MRALQGGAVGCLLVGFVLWQPLISMMHVWRNNQAYQYAWLIVPLLIYLLGWHHRAAPLLTRPKPDMSGVLIAIVGALCWMASDLMNVDAGGQLAFVIAIQGVCMAAVGWRCYWRLFPFFGLLFLMIPCGDFLQPALRHLTIKAIEFLVVALHLPHQVNGFQISIGENAYVVLNECAGLPHFLLATFLGYAFGLMLYRSFCKVLALAVFGAFIGILSNFLRVSGIVLIDWIQRSQMPLTAHGNIQWAVLFACLGLLFFVLGRLEEDGFSQGQEVATAKPEIFFPPWPPVFAGAAVLIICGASVWGTSSGAYFGGDMLIHTMPRSVSGWKLATLAQAWSVDSQNTTRSLLLNYQRDDDVLRVRITEITSAAAKLQDSESAPGKTNIWHETDIAGQVACVATVCTKLMHTTWVNGATEEHQHVYSTYALGDFFTTSKFALRAAYGWGRLLRGTNKPRLIVLTLDSAVTAEVLEEFAVMVRSFQSTLELGH